MNNFENIKKKLISNLKNVQIKDLDKEKLIELIYLFNTLSSKEFLEEISDNLELIKNDNINFIDINARTASLLLKFKKKNYIKKLENEFYQLYEYDDRFDIYFSNEINPTNLIEFIKNLANNDWDLKNENIAYVTLLQKNKKKYEMLYKFDSVCGIKNNWEFFKLNEYFYSELKLQLFRKIKVL